MAAYDIQKHFSGLRVQTARRRGRDPFATGFEDESEEERRKSRSTKTKSPVTAPPRKQVTSPSSPFAHIDALQPDSDDDFLNLPKKQDSRADRRPSPAPAKLASLSATNGARRGSLPGISTNDPKKAVVLAAGPLAYLDDSEDDEALPVRRTDRRPSPAPRKGSDESYGDRSHTPRGIDHLGRKEPIPKHTVASPFAGTKYLQDSDSEEEAVSSRKNSAESPLDEAANAKPTHLEVKRVDKPKQNGSGVSWRAFSASRAEQRYAEVEALQASLRQRGRAISFSPHATTDDGQRVPISPSSERPPIGARGRSQGRSRSPPRRAEDTKPTRDEIVDGQPSGNRGFDGVYDAAEYKTNPFTVTRNTKMSPPTASQIFASTALPSNESSPMASASPSSASNQAESIDAIATKLTVSPQTIPETAAIDHSLHSPLASPSADYERDPLSRNSSTRSLRTQRQSRNAGSRRSSRRSNSGNTSISPAHAFLSSWGRAEAEEEAVPETQPDDEGQCIGLENEYIIGRTISRGGFGVVKEVHSIDENGGTVIRAVKTVRKSIVGANDVENDKLQQEVEHEVSIWRHMNHRHVLSLHAVYETDFATFCIMDLNVGGTLFDLVRKARQISSQNNGRKGLPPNLAKSYAYQLACALRYLHEDIRVCHRDIKLENCLIDLSVPDAHENGGNLRLCDFGLADFLHSESIDEGQSGRYSGQTSLSAEAPVSTTSSVIGTLEYASPKGLSVNRKLFETAGDVWAFGVIVYALCTGDLPFRHPMPSKTAELILRADWDETALRDAAAGGGEVIDLVKGCLEKDIDLRLTIGDALRNAWFDGVREKTEESLQGADWT